MGAFGDMGNVGVRLCMYGVGGGASEPWGSDFTGWGCVWASFVPLAEHHLLKARAIASIGSRASGRVSL